MVETTTARQFVIAALIFTAVITGLFALISLSVPTTSGDFNTYNRSFSKFVEIRDNTDDMAGDTETAEPAEGIEGILSGLYSASFGIVKQIWTSVTTMKAIIGDMSEGGMTLGMPTWFTGLMVAIIGITVALALIASWRKWYV